MKEVILLILICGCMNAVMAQENPPEQNPEMDNGKGELRGLFGKAIDNKTNKAIEAASVQVYTSKNGKDSLIAGMLTKANGDFLFAGLNLPQKFTVIITALGYGESYQSVELPDDYGSSICVFTPVIYKRWIGCSITVG